MTHQILRVCGKTITVLNNNLGYVLEVPDLKVAMDMIVILNKNRVKDCIYKIRSIKEKK